MAKTKTIENLFIFRYLDFLSALVPISLFIRYWKLSYPKAGLRIIFFYMIANFLIDLTAHILNLLYGEYTVPFLNTFYTIAEIVGFVGFLYLEILSKSIRRAVFIAGLSCILLALTRAFLVQSVEMIDSVSIGVMTIIVLVFSFYYLYERTDDTQTLYIYSSFPFWIVVGMVLYLAGSFFVYIFADSLDQTDTSTYWTIPNIFSLFKNIFFTIAILVNSKPSKKIPISNYEFSSLN